MAKRLTKAEQQKIRIRRRIALIVLLICALAVGGLLSLMHIEATSVHLCSADVYLQDLPQAFDGTTLLFISDIDIRNGRDAARCRRIFSKLFDLQPDLLLLGGDYSARTLMELLNGASSVTAKDEAVNFIGKLGDFDAALGKYAVLGDHDGDAEAYRAAFEAADVHLLENSCVEIEKDGETLVIAGLSDASQTLTPYSQLGGHFSGDECVIAVAHNPSAYSGIMVSEAGNGGTWADLVLTGHTLGGQIKAFGRTLRNMPESERRTLSGWYYGDTLPLLVSQGLGCEGTLLRLGSQSEVWLITLKKTQVVDMTSLPRLVVSDQ